MLRDTVTNIDSGICGSIESVPQPEHTCRYDETAESGVCRSMSRSGLESVFDSHDDEAGSVFAAGDTGQLVDFGNHDDGDVGADATASLHQRLDLNARDVPGSSDDSGLAATADMGDGHLLNQNPELLDDSEEHAAVSRSPDIDHDTTTTITVTVTITRPLPIPTSRHHASTDELAHPPPVLSCDCERMPAVCCYCC